MFFVDWRNEAVGLIEGIGRTIGHGYFVDWRKEVMGLIEGIGTCTRRTVFWGTGARRQ